MAATRGRCGPLAEPDTTSACQLDGQFGDVSLDSLRKRKKKLKAQAKAKKGETRECGNL